MTPNYTGSGIYDAIYARYPEASTLVGVAGEAWNLIYATAAGSPIFLVHAQIRNLSTVPSGVVEATHEALAAIGQLAALPAGSIRFDASGQTLRTVEVGGALSGNGEPEEIALPVLRDRFANLGLPVTAGQAMKAINNASSSAYHDWQRQSLGSGIVVTDLDLVGPMPSNSPTELHEIKRSFQPFTQWKPYNADRANYEIQAELARMMNGVALAAYHLKEDPSHLLLFHVEKGRQPTSYNRVGEYTIDEYLAGDYRSDL